MKIGTLWSALVVMAGLGAIGGVVKYKPKKNTENTPKNLGLDK